VRRFLTMAIIGMMFVAASASLQARGKGKGGKGPRGPKGPGDGSCGQSCVMQAQDEVQECRGGGRRRGPGDGSGPARDGGCGEFVDENGDGICDICDGPVGDGPKGGGDGGCEGDGPKGPRRGRR